jgi:uncharacterized membrane protein
VTLLEPAWLAIAIPLAFALARWPPATRLRRLLRAALFGVLALALARPAVLLPRRGGTLVVVADRSASMPAESAEVEDEVLRRLASARGVHDRLAVAAFGARAAAESAGEGFHGFTADVGREASDLAAALDLALGLLPAGDAGRLLVVSDGRWTGRDPEGAAARAALRGAAIDYRLLERAATADLAVERLEAPHQASPGEGFLVSAWVRSPARQEVEVELRRGGRLVAAGRRQVAAGRSRFTFRDRAGAAGVEQYSVTVRGVTVAPAAAGDPAAGDPAAGDPVPENDVARFLLEVRGPRPVLVVSGAATGTAELLRRGGLDARAAAPGEAALTLAELAGYSAVVLENVPAGDLGEAALESLAAWVRGAGGGLMMTGGEHSFGPGGYFRSPLEEVLPVSMELRQEHRKMALAMAVALDRSGSMAVAVGGGRTKMDLANLATAEVLGLLSPFDDFAVVAVDSSPHIVLPLEPVGEATAAKRETILRIDSAGGGIFVYAALHAAVEQLLRSQAGARHVLLFADAADAEEPGAYRELLERCARSGITVSVVGLGSAADVDAPLLRDVATRGGGRVFFTASPEALPRLFAQDAFVVARSTFVGEPTAFAFTAALRTLAGQPFDGPPRLGGYNLTYLRPEAQLAALTRDDHEAPVVAFWQAGLGRALAWTAELGGAHAGELGAWPRLGELAASLVRWTAGESDALGGDVAVTQELRRGTLRVALHLDPERQGDPFTAPPRLAVLSGVPGRPPAAAEQAMRWRDPDTLEAVVELAGEEVALGRLEVPGLGSAALAPARLPYAPEYAPAEPGAGHLALERLARTTGGRQRIDVADVWDDFERRPRTVELTPWLLALALVLLLLEVLERRTALLSSRWRVGWRLPRWRRPAAEPRAETAAPRPQAAVARQRETPQEPGAAEAGEPSGILSALERARQRSGRRTRR